MTKMVHPDSKQTIDVSPDRMAMYESAGWRAKPPPAKRAAKKATPAKADAEEPSEDTDS